MKKSFHPILLGTFVAGGLLAGCAGAPDDQVTEAQEALAAAELAQANLYVADLYQAAQDSFAAAQEEIEIQKEASAFSRDYDRAERLLAFATETAATAATQVEERKVTMHADTEALIAEAEQVLAEAQTLIQQAPRSGQQSVSLVSATEDTGTARQMLDDAAAAFAQGDVATAYQLAQSALEKANALVAALQTEAGTPRS